MRDKRPSLLLFVFFLCLYTLTFKGICTGDNLLHYHVVENLIEHGEFSLPDERYDIRKQPYLKFFAAEGLDGRLFLTLPPGLALASIPLCSVGVALEVLTQPGGVTSGEHEKSRRSLSEIRTKPSAFFAGLINPLASALLVVASFRFARLITQSPTQSLILSATLGLGTIVWPYSSTYWKQPLTALFLFASLYLLYRGLQHPRSGGLCSLSGLLVGCAFLTRYEVVFVVPWFLLLIAMKSYPSFRTILRSALFFLGSFSLSVLFQLWWNAHRFGSVFETGAAHQAFFSASLKSNLLLTVPAHVLSLNRSIFVFSPPLLLCLACILPFYRKQRALAITVVGVVVTGLLLYSKFTLWSTPASWGPRYLVWMTPFLLLPACLLRPNTRRSTVLLLCVLVAGALIQVIAVLGPYQHAAVSSYFGDEGASASYFWKTEIIPQFRAVVAGNIEFWWLRSPLLGVAAVTLAAIMGISGYRLVRMLRAGPDPGLDSAWMT